MNMQRVLSNDSARPYAIHQRILGDQFIGRLNKDLHDRERAGADGDRDTACQQFAPPEVDLPLA